MVGDMLSIEMVFVHPITKEHTLYKFDTCDEAMLCGMFMVRADHSLVKSTFSGTGDAHRACGETPTPAIALANLRASGMRV